MKFVALTVCLAVGMLLAGCCRFKAAAEEEIFYRNDFNTPASISGWSLPAGMTYEKNAGRGGSGCLLFSNISDGDDRLAKFSFDGVEKLRGRAVMLEGYLKAEEIGKMKFSYLGPKLMLAVTYRENQKDHFDQEKALGTYDWRKFTVFTRIPQSATHVELQVGLQGCVGKLWIDDLKITFVPTPAVPQGGLKNQLPVQKEVKYRGVMFGHDRSEAAFKELGEVWNANLIRFLINSKYNSDETNATEEGYRAIVKRSLDELDAILPFARKYGIKIVIDMHIGPGTSRDELLSNKLSWEPETQQLLADVWREIAAKYKDEPMIYGYDLMNEPREETYVYTPAGALDWNRLAEKIARAIREVDPATPIIVEGAQWANPASFDNLVPIDVPNVIYSFHFYSPHGYTHQGVGNRPVNLTYPGAMFGREWNKATMEKEMAPVIEFQKKYNVPIYMGEFSAIRWAPGADQWVEDAIELFEKYGWDWTYHAFREWEGWDAELGPVKGDSTRIKDTPRRAMLLKYMRRNQR